MRNPLANIKSLVSLLKNVDNEQVELFIGLLDKSTQRLDDILNGLIELIQVANKKELANQCEFDSILATIQTEFRGQLDQIQGEIRADFTAYPSIKYVKPYLESLFRNMISNSIKYRSLNRLLHVSISTRRQEDYIVVAFQDNGIGIDLSDADKIFKPFYQIDYAQEGKGMGLHIVKNILEKNGGKIEVSSQINQGTTFTAYLKEY